MFGAPEIKFLCVVLVVYALYIVLPNVLSYTKEKLTEKCRLLYCHANTAGVL